MTDNLTPAGAHAVRLAQRAVKLKAQRDHARTVAIALEQRLARVETTLPMTFLVTWLEGGHQTTDFPTERASERFAREKVKSGVKQVVVYEVGDGDE